MELHGVKKTLFFEQTLTQIRARTVRTFLWKKKFRKEMNT